MVCSELMRTDITIIRHSYYPQNIKRLLKQHAFHPLRNEKRLLLLLALTTTSSNPTFQFRFVIIPSVPINNPIINGDMKLSLNILASVAIIEFDPVDELDPGDVLETIGKLL